MIASLFDTIKAQVRKNATMFVFSVFTLDSYPKGFFSVNDTDNIKAKQLLSLIQLSLTFQTCMT